MDCEHPGSGCSDTPLGKSKGYTGEGSVFKRTTGYGGVDVALLRFVARQCAGWK
ncbi:hypothetical protein KCP77_12765 [Salmonella enterica subsp. enterica]|nr:hypothetical protein KCP77_12765 [Salmonella enterica subsp. enterica]